MDEIRMLRAETDRLDGLLRGLDDTQWAAPSACDGWSVADVVLHLAQSEESVVSAIEDSDATLPFARYAEGADSVDAVMAAAIEAERGDPGAAVRDRWRAAHDRALALLEAADPKDVVPWAATPLKVRTLTVTRLAEHWIHSMDVHGPLGVDLPDTDRLWPIARLAHRTIPYAFAMNDLGEPPSVRLELKAPDGAPWTFGDEGAEVVISGPAGDLCRVAARRLDPANSALAATGDRAPDVLRVIRTYA